VDKPLELIGALVVVFIAWLYFPYLIFKTGAETFVDLGRPRDSSELEEFLGAALPSMLIIVVVHLFNQGMARFLSLFALTRHWDIGRRILLDWPTIGALLSGEGWEIAHGFLADPWRRGGVTSFLLRLVITSFLSGIWFGYCARRRLKVPRLKDRVPKDGGWKGVRAWLKFALFDLLPTPFFLVLWNHYSHELIEPLMAWKLQKPHVFLRTAGDSRLYFGQFIDYEKSARGEIDRVLLREPSRYCYDEVDKCLGEGRLPISKLGGELVVKWDAVVDIHVIPANSFEELEKRYLRLRMQHLGGELLRGFNGQNFLTVPEIYRAHAGATGLKLEDYRAAVALLAEDGLVQLDPPVDVGKQPIGDEVAVQFPKRVDRPAAPARC
jgi:hypothetical protein